jgi:choline dehydrogenase-like flavoprotein
VKGVWIGDGSAFPTPTGTNPMVSIMALAHRTAEAIAGTRVESRPAELTRS